MRRARIFVWEWWALERILPRVLTSLPMFCCQDQQSVCFRPYFVTFTAKFYAYHLCSFHFLIFEISWLHRFYPNWLML